MEQHVKILAILNIVLGSLGLLVALMMLLFFGGMSGVVLHDADPDAGVGAAVLGMAGGIAFFVIALFSLPGLIGGIGLLKFQEWARIVIIVTSILNLISIPFGTAVGIYGLWVLMKPETMTLLKAKNAPA
jgi:hypothetical protein